MPSGAFAPRREKSGGLGGDSVWSERDGTTARAARPAPGFVAEARAGVFLRRRRAWREEEREEAQAAALEALERGGPGFGGAMAADQAGLFLGINFGIDHGVASWRGRRRWLPPATVYSNKKSGRKPEPKRLIYACL